MTTPATLTDLPRVHRALLVRLAGGAVETVTPTEDALAHTLERWGLAVKVGLCEWEITEGGKRLTKGNEEGSMVQSTKWKRYPKGSQVAYREGFTNIVRVGEVVSVEDAPNGYPITIVNFPGWKGKIEFAVEALCTPDQFQSSVNWWAT